MLFHIQAVGACKRKQVQQIDMSIKQTFAFADWDGCVVLSRRGLGLLRERSVTFQFIYECASINKTVTDLHVHTTDVHRAFHDFRPALKRCDLVNE